MRRSRSTYLATLAAVALAAGCSLVNSLDEITPADDGTFTSVNRPDAGGAVFEDAGPPPSTLDASEGGPATEAFSALVVGGEAAVGDAGALAPILTVLDSKSGREVATRERMWVAGVAYDAPRDVWYIFEAPSYFIPGPSEVVKLHIRKLDNMSGAWTELATLDVPPILYYDAIAVTNERVSFIVHPATGIPQFRMITVDTSTLGAPKVNSTVTLAQMPRGMIATRSSAGPGGYVNLLNVGSGTAPPDAGPEVEADCVGTGGNAVCVARIRQYLLPNNANGQPVLVNTLKYGQMAGTGQPGYASALCAGPDDVTVLPTANGTQHVWSRAYLDTQSTELRTFPMSQSVAAPTLLRKGAMDSKRRILFMVEANSDTNLHAVPLDVAVSVGTAPLRHSGQSVYYDPSSETVFSPFNQGDGFTFSAFRVALGATVSLQERSPATDWKPPTDLRPLLLGIKSPVAECQ